MYRTTGCQRHVIVSTQQPGSDILHSVYTGRSLPQPVGATGCGDDRRNRLRRRSPRVNATGNRRRDDRQLVATWLLD